MMDNITLTTNVEHKMPHIWVGDIGRVTTIVLSACSYLHSTILKVYTFLCLPSVQLGVLSLILGIYLNK
jgi:hypothetical protein